ncbi:MAG: DUF167 family protein [Rhizomicrobium sp.]
MQILDALTEPVFRQVRRIIPPIRGLDLFAHHRVDLRRAAAGSSSQPHSLPDVSALDGDGARLRTRDGGILFALRLTPKGRAATPSRAGAWAPMGASTSEARVASPPEDGKANAALIALLAKTLDVRKTTIEIIAGETSRLKTIAIAAPAAETIRRLETIGGCQVTAKIIDGKAAAAKLRERIVTETAALKSAHGIVPGARHRAGRQRSGERGLCPQQGQDGRGHRLQVAALLSPRRRVGGRGAGARQGAQRRQVRTRNPGPDAAAVAGGARPRCSTCSIRPRTSTR